MNNELCLNLLGGLEISRDGAAVEGFAHQKSLALLCYLAVTGQPHTRAALANLLWGEATEANGLGGLRKTLVDLRRQVAPYLSITRQQVAFSREKPTWLDVETFEHQIEAIGELHGARLTIEDAARLADGVDLYHGDFLAGFHVRRAPAFEEWVLLQRERLRLAALRALHVLSAHYMAQGTYPQAIEYAKRILTLEPCQEEAHRQMMSALALSGQREAALRQYQTCCRALAEEMGAAPQDETTALFQRIRDGDTTTPHAPAASQNLPCPITPLIGREKERGEIIARLRTLDCRLLTLVGPGGCGKTRLAQAIAATFTAPALSTGADAWPGDLDEAFMVSLAPLRSAESLVPAIAHGIGLLLSHEGDPRQELLNYLHQKHHLLILDNFEHLLSPAGGEGGGGAALLADILAAAPAVKILVTSRIRLNLQAEQLYPLAGMDVAPLPLRSGHRPRPAGGNEGGHAAAVQLFLWGARRVKPDLDPTDEDLEAIGRICYLVAGMPLAILLAATWARVLTPVEIAAQLAGSVGKAPGGPLAFLETDWIDVPARQRSMRVVFDQSWSLLTEQERATLSALSVFRGGFTRQAAQQVVGGCLRELMGLVDRSLVLWVGSRYEMHELLRQYAAGHLSQSEASESVQERHGAYYAGRLRVWAADLKGEGQIAALEEMEGELANVRAAWDWMVSRADVVRLDMALEGLCLFYEWRGRRPEGQSACQAAAQALSKAPSRPIPAGAQSGETRTANRVLAMVLAWQGVFSPDERAGQLFQDGLTLLRGAGLAGTDTRREEAFILHKMGGLAEGDVALVEQSLALYRQLDDARGTAQALEVLAWSTWNAGLYGKMERLYQECLSIYQALGDRRGIAAASQWLGIAFLYQGRLEGESLVRDGIAINEEIGDRSHIAHGLVAAGLGLLSLGRFAEAHAFLQDGVTVYDDLGISAPFARMLLGGAKVLMGQYEQGRAWGQAVLDATGQRDRSIVGFPLIVLGWAALARESYDEAQRLFQEGVDACQDVEQRELHSWVLAFLGYADRGRGQLGQASVHLRQSLQMAVEIPSYVGLAFALPGVALLMADLGHQERAVELYALASCQPVVANSRWFVDVVERPVAAMVAGLSSDIITAAEARGQARDLEATVAELIEELDRGIDQAP